MLNVLTNVFDQDLKEFNKAISNIDQRWTMAGGSVRITLDMTILMILCSILMMIVKINNKKTRFSSNQNNYDEDDENAGNRRKEKCHIFLIILFFVVVVLCFLGLDIGFISKNN